MREGEKIVRDFEEITGEKFQVIIEHDPRTRTVCGILAGRKFFVSEHLPNANAMLMRMALVYAKNIIKMKPKLRAAKWRRHSVRRMA